MGFNSAFKGLNRYKSSIFGVKCHAVSIAEEVQTLGERDTLLRPITFATADDSLHQGVTLSFEKNQTVT